MRFESPPVLESVDPIAISSGEKFSASLKYFSYGVVIVELELRFEADWKDLVRLSSRFMAEPEIEKRTLELVQARLSLLSPALVQSYPSWLSEDYYIINVQHVLDEDANIIPANVLLDRHGDDIACLVRGESAPLAAEERAEALQSGLSYYPADLLVVGWLAAFVCDTTEGAEPAIQLLEYANGQLLEFRHYDDVLSRILQDVYKALERRGGPLRHWGMSREARRLNAVRLDVTDLTERTDNAIKFIGDMFYARAYRLAATRVGVPDYRNLVERKLRIAADLYQSMVSDYHQTRSFVLGAMVVAILVIELIHLIRGAF